MNDSLQQRIADALAGELSGDEQERFHACLKADAELRDEMEGAQRVLDALRELPAETVRQDLAPAILEQARQSEAVAAQGGDMLPLASWVNRMHVAAAASVLFCMAVFILSRRAGPPPSAEAPVPIGELLSAVSADPRIQACVWLSRTQRSDGSFPVTQHGGKAQSEVGVTGLALLAYAESGPDFHEPAARAAEYLLTRQSDSGCIGNASHLTMYNHGIATLALLKTPPDARSPAHARALSRAVAFLTGSQNDAGGWGYRGATSEKANVSTSAWQILALHEATAQGMDEARPALERGLAYLKHRVRADGQVAYAGETVRPGDRALTTVGAVCLLLDESTRSTGENALAAALRAPSGRISALERSDPYLTYFLRLASGASGRSQARQHLAVPLRDLLARQVVSGPEVGSLPAETTPWGAVGGRVYSTAMLAISLPETL